MLTNSVPISPIDTKISLEQVMTWCRTMMTQFTAACIDVSSRLNVFNSIVRPWQIFAEVAISGAFVVKSNHMTIYFSPEKQGF